MRFTGLVIAKMHSERVKNKVARDLCGRRLINYAIETLNMVPEIDETIVFCSDPAIQKYIEPHLDYRFVQRPEWLDDGATTEIELFDEFIKICKPEYIVSHWCTSPYIKPETICDMVAAMKTGDYDSANVRVCLSEHFQNVMYDDTPMNFRFDHDVRSQAAEKVYGEVWTRVFPAELHTKYRRRVGFKPYWKTVSIAEGWDIDTEEEFRIAEVLGTINHSDRKPLLLEYMQARDWTE